MSFLIIRLCQWLSPQTMVPTSVGRAAELRRLPLPWRPLSFALAPDNCQMFPNAKKQDLIEGVKPQLAKNCAVSMCHAI
jgi:hypothetical protein